MVLAVLSRSVPLQRWMAILIAMAVCCLSAVGPTIDSHPGFGDQKLGRATATHDQVLIACNGTTNVLPAAPVAKARLAVIPARAIALSPAATAAAGDAWRARIPAPGASRLRLVGVVELRI